MKRSWLDKHWPVLAYIFVVIISLSVVWLIAYRVGLAKGELIQYENDIKYVEELQQDLQDEIDRIHTCPYCGKIFTVWNEGRTIERR